MRQVGLVGRIAVKMPWAATEVFISSQCLNNFQEKKTNSMRQMGLVRCISTEERIHKYSSISAFIHICIHLLALISSQKFSKLGPIQHPRLKRSFFSNVPCYTGVFSMIVSQLVIFPLVLKHGKNVLPNYKMILWYLSFSTTMTIFHKVYWAFSWHKPNAFDLRKRMFQCKIMSV